MGSGFADQIAEGITTGNPWLLPLAFVGGLCTSLNPCVYPMLAVVVGYVSTHGDRSAWRSTGLAAAFVLGLALTYAMLGAVGSLLAPVLGLSHRGWLRVVGATCIVAGLFMAGLVPFDIPSFAPGSRVRERLRGAPGAVVLGALLGLAATPCATPPLVAIMSAAAAHRSAMFGAVLLFVYAVGHAAPVLAIGLVCGTLGGLQRFAPYGRVLQLAGGWLMIAAGLYLVLIS